ncbi:MAG: hypothetical protein JXB25_07675 [Deltaproteobacteria bacterium]|nr:hypothetical protein [Deltaproteobacteria bacterium]
MSELASQIKRILPANKFHPPRFDPSRQIFRESLILEITEGKWAKKRHIVLEAQAGQGKTTLAAQLLHKAQTLSFWYQVGREDCDPIFFLSSLYVFFQESFPGFAAPEFEERILLGVVFPAEAPELGSQLLMAVSDLLPAGCFLVFDDLHCLDKAPLSGAILAHLVRTPVEKVRFLLLSRHKVPVLSETLYQDRDTVVLSGRELAFTRRETCALGNEIFRTPLPLKDVAEIHQLTEGWIMGILFLLKYRASAGTGSPLEWESGKKPAELIGFFVRDLLEAFTPKIRRMLLLLALLDEVPSSLADYLGSEGAVRKALEEMVAKNLFVQYLAEEEKAPGAFRFHQLFRETLRSIAHEQFEKPEINRFLKTVAEWFLRQDKPLLGLQYLLLAGDLARVQGIVRESGIRMLSQGLHITLWQLLGRLPAPVLKEYPWLALVYGMATVEIEPASAYPFLESASERLGRVKDLAGELYSLALRLTYHVAVDGRYGAGSRLLPRTDGLFRQLAAELDPFAAMQITFALGLGFCFFDCDLGAARRYSDLSMGLALRHGSHKYQAANRMLGAYIQFFAGNTQGCLDEIEKSVELLKSPLISQFFKLYLFLFRINFAEAAGDFINYERLKNRFRRYFNKDLIANSVAGPCLMLWDIDQALSEGRFDEAWNLVGKALAKDSAAASDHMRSQYLQYGAYLAALKGERERALEWAERSAAHRQIAGGRYYSEVNQMFLGATFSLLGEPERAEYHFDEALTRFYRNPDPWMLAAVLFHRAHHRLGQSRTNEGLRDLSEALRHLRRHQYRNFFGWNPRVMRTLLETGVAHKVEPDYCRWLARERLNRVIRPDGTSIPCLFIKALGPLEITFGDGPVVTAPDLSEIQRRLLAIILMSPGRQVSQESLQDQLWQECDSGKGRKRFDTALFRLRKILDERLGAFPFQEYIQMQSGILSLRNCRLDTEEFVEKAQRGQRHYQNGEYWQACQFFGNAHSLWRGKFMANTPLEPREEAHRNGLLNCFLDVCSKWADIFSRSGHCGDAETIAWSALKEDPTNEPLVRVLYKCYVDQGLPVKAAHLLKRYEAALRQEEYLVEEVDDILENFWKAP